MGSTSTGLHWRGSSQRTGEVFSRDRRVRGARVARRVSAESIYDTIHVAPDTLLRGERILIATGSSPVRLPEFPFEHPRVHDSDEILEIGTLPKTLAVVGAGVIGAEYACTFAALGVEVHLVDGRHSLLSFLDREISQNIERAMTAHGVNFIWKEKVVRCDAPANGEITLTLTSR